LDVSVCEDGFRGDGGPVVGHSSATGRVILVLLTIVVLTLLVLRGIRWSSATNPARAGSDGVAVISLRGVLMFQSTLPRGEPRQPATTPTARAGAPRHPTSPQAHLVVRCVSARSSAPTRCEIASVDVTVDVTDARQRIRFRRRAVGGDCGRISPV
jgi:hypothetical protein